MSECECTCKDIIIEMTPEGQDGNGIVRIDLLSEVDTVKTYRIIFTNGTHFDYVVTDGSSIATIAKTSTDVLVDTYTITLTNGDTTTFEVTNGRGIVSIAKTATSNLTDTYTISFNDGTSSTFEVTNGNSISGVSKVSTNVLTDTYKITYTDTEKAADTFTVVNGRGISSISKTSTADLVDTYTITYNDSTTSTYTVTNGMPATHSWDGTVLTITSASGTSSADLKGATGDAATVAVGAVTTGNPGTDVSITNSGDEHAAVFNFTIPRGDTGNGIESIELYDTTGLVKTYRITFTDGDYYDFTVNDGNGIASVEKTATAGLVDTYTITFTNGDTTTFDVTNGSDTWGDITGTLSDQTDLQDALNDKAPVIIAEASGSVAAFSDGAPMPVESLTVGVEPVQDLHGYANPWPAGGGKNIIPDGKDTSKGYVSLHYLKNDGTEVSDNNYHISEYFPVEASTLYGLKKYGTYTANAPSVCFYDSNKDYISGENYQNRTDFTVTTPATAAFARVTLISNGTSPILFTKGSTYPTSWEPYSNICPISGHTSAVVTRTGKNLLDNTAESGTSGEAQFTVNADGTVDVKTTGTTTATRWMVLGEFTLRAGTYAYNGCPSGGGSSTYMLTIRNADKGSISGIVDEVGNGRTFTITESLTAYMMIRVGNGANISTPVTFKPMIRLASDPDDTYEPYQGTSLTIPFGSTVYGASLDVLTGVMTVDRAIVTYDGSDDESWSASSNQRYYIIVPDAKILDTNTRYECLCNRGKYASSGGSFGNCFMFSDAINHRSAFYYCSNSEDLTAFRSWLASNNLQVVYTLATPTTVQLTPAQLSTLLGDNVLWASTGDVSLTYRADTKLYIDGQVASANRKTREMLTTVTDTMKAPKNLTSGDLIIVGDDLYKATSNIASGATLTVGSNVVKLTLAEYIQSLL